MASLSATTQLTRTLLKWLGIAISAALLILIIFRIAVFIKSQITPPPPPDTAFGKLPAINFEKNSATDDFSYSINTVTGSLPVFPDRTNVYKIIQDRPQLLALTNTSTKLANIGFKSSPTVISETVYQWIQADSASKLPRKIALDIFSGDFNLTSPFLSDSDVLSSNNLPNESAAINAASLFISSINHLPNDIDSTKTTATLLAIKNGGLSPTSSLSSTHVIKVSFFQKDLDELPIVYPDPNSSTINVFVSGGSSDMPQVIKADFFHQDIASESATYPIITSSQAFDKLKSGDAYIVNDNPNNTISINKVFLAYYLSSQKQKFVMPVIVFTGNGFTAYVSAIKDEWIQK